MSLVENSHILWESPNSFLQTEISGQQTMENLFLNQIGSASSFESTVNKANNSIVSSNDALDLWLGTADE